MAEIYLYTIRDAERDAIKVYEPVMGDSNADSHTARKR